MKIVRHISLNATDRDFRELEALGVVLPKMGNVPKGFKVFDLAESDERWPAVRQWFLRRGERPGWEHTEFAASELAEAEWLNMHSEWHHGYPQPESDFGYEKLTYDTAAACPERSVGKRQKAPFRFRGEPRWGRRNILQLNWVFDEFFVTPEVWETVFRPFGVPSGPVLNTRGTEFATVVQLLVEERVPMLPAPDLPTEVCERCGVEKYNPIRRGPLRQLAELPTSHMARTADWFGSGHEARNEVVVSHDLWTAIVAARVRGVACSPVASEPWIDPGVEYVDPPADPAGVKRFLAAIRGESPEELAGIEELRTAGLLLGPQEQPPHG